MPWKIAQWAHTENYIDISMRRQKTKRIDIGDETLPETIGRVF